VCLDQEFLARRILAAFGVTIELSDISWTTAHGDLHWANLMAPECWLLDWESWGSAPTGYDAALIYCTSLLEPGTAEAAHHTFADLLDSPAGIIAQLAAAAKLLRHVEDGDHPDLALVLHTYVRRLLSLRRGLDSLGKM
jgi:hypothetical protein